MPSEAPAVVLQDLLNGVRDRVVVAVTFLAMLELMKRREIVGRAGRAVGADRRPRDHAARNSAAAGVDGRWRDPLDESLDRSRDGRRTRPADRSAAGEGSGTGRQRVATRRSRRRAPSS